MFYIFFLLLVVVIPVVFYLSTRQFRAWPAINERWFKAGIENGFIFNSTRVDGTVTLELKGEYTFQYMSCIVSLSTSKRLSVVRAELPESLRVALSGYPVDTLSAFFDLVERILSGQLEDLEEPYSTKVGDTGRKLNPKIVEQLLAIRREYLRPGRRFTLTATTISYEQDTLVVEPSTLFPVLDELVVLLYVMAENKDHLFLKA